LNMRQKIISLSLDTYELASKKANFSAWVRRKLMEEVETVTIAKKMYGAYCFKCDVMYQNSIEFMMESHYCKKCNTRCKFAGELE
jgi:hypothetical protein